MQKKFWHFEPEKSVGSLDDEIYTLNMIAVAASDATRYPGARQWQINIQLIYLSHL